MKLIGDVEFMYNEMVMGFMKMRLEWYNSTTGNLKGYNCPLCKNRGDFYVIRDGYLFSQDCECMKIRNAIREANNSGFDGSMKVNTFDTYKAESNWQEDVLKKAKAFVVNGKWFAILGESGSGKTHICTAITRDLFMQGKSVKYMQWVEDSGRLKARVNEPQEYDALLDVFKNAEVLFIDDLFKIEPTIADVRLAYELINYRYVKKLTTIISSEKQLDELMEIDSAIAGRINEMAGNYLIKIKGKDKNLRF